MPPTLKSFATSESDHSHEIERDVRSCTPTGSNTLQSLLPRHIVSDTAHNLLSHLGNHNPWPRPVTKHDELWLMDNTAFPSAKQDQREGQTHGWQAEFVTAVFSQETSCAVSDAVVQMAKDLGLAVDDEAKNTLATRLRPFLLNIQTGKKVTVLQGGDLSLKLGPGGRSGVSSDIRVISSAAAGVIVPTIAVVPQSTTGLLQCKTFYSEAEGWAVISDIDDTIKVTMTSEVVGILRSTLVDKPQPVEGMPEFYRFLQSQITSSSPFFYLSASPYNLYPFLRDFRDAYFPHGQLVLRDSSWMSLPGFLSTITLGTQAYKTDRIDKIHRWLPKKAVIAIGDSTQTDPESYAEAYRKFGPQWIRLILIRRVTGVASIGIEQKNTPERFEKAFMGIPSSVWHVFDSPSECYQIVRDVVKVAEGDDLH